MTEVPPDVKAALQRIAAMPDTVEREGYVMPVVSSMVLRPAGARALLPALDSQKQSDASPDGNPDASHRDVLLGVLEHATSDQTLYYLRSIYRMLDGARAVSGPTLAGEALADNLDWLDIHIDWLERPARGALSK